MVITTRSEKKKQKNIKIINRRQVSPNHQDLKRDHQPPNSSAVEPITTTTVQTSDLEDSSSSLDSRRTVVLRRLDDQPNMDPSQTVTKSKGNNNLSSPSTKLIRTNPSSIYSVNPFGDRTNSSKEKRKSPSSKESSTASLVSPDKQPCRRLSLESHRRCCATRDDEGEIHEDDCVHATRSGRAKRDVSSDHKRSQSVPRRHIPVTTTYLKRTEYNLERAQKFAAQKEIELLEAMSPVVTPGRPRRPLTPSSTTSASSITAFSTKKTPSGSATIAKGIMSGQKVSKKAIPVPGHSKAFTYSRTPVETSMKGIDGLTGSLRKRSGSTSDITPSGLSLSRQIGSGTQVTTARINMKTPHGSKEMVASRSSGFLVDQPDSGSGGCNRPLNLKLKLNLVCGKTDADGNCDAETPTGRLGYSTTTACSPPRRRLSHLTDLPDPTLSPRSRSKQLLRYSVTPDKEPIVEKSAVSVAVRLRPFSEAEKKNSQARKIVTLDRREKKVTVNNRHEFEFTHVLDSFDSDDPIDDQESLYNTVGKPILDHCLEGFNACLFAYGQTGSGKTYSMTGVEDSYYPEKRGVIPRFIEDLFVNIRPLDTIISMQYIEIYNDQIKNLLEDKTSSQKPRPTVYKIREHSLKGPYIPNLPPIIVDGKDDLISRWAMGNLERKTAATKSNDESSRSHAILTITVEQKYPEDPQESDTDSQVSDGERLTSSVNLVDLAGSERVAQAQTTGDRFKEGTSINKSLLTLGKVISELSSVSENQRSRVHIPYRESPLTFLLKESLGGNSKTIMLATISPSSLQMEETISTLRYAAKASRIVNTVRINDDPKIIRIRILEEQIQSLLFELDKRDNILRRYQNLAITTDADSSPESCITATSGTTTATSDYKTPMKTPRKESKKSKVETTTSSPDSESTIAAASSISSSPAKKKKNETSQDDDSSPPSKRDKRSVSVEARSVKQTKESAVMTDSSPEPKVLKVKKVNIAPPPKSNLLEEVEDMFSDSGHQDRRSEEKRERRDSRSGSRDEQKSSSKDRQKIQEEKKARDKTPEQAKTTKDDKSSKSSKERTPTVTQQDKQSKKTTPKEIAVEREECTHSEKKKDVKKPDKSPEKRDRQPENKQQKEQPEKKQPKEQPEKKQPKEPEKKQQKEQPEKKSEKEKKTCEEKSTKKSDEKISNKGGKDRKSKTPSPRPHTADDTEDTFVSAGDGSSVLNRAMIETSSMTTWGTSTEQVEDPSLHVHFKEDVSVRSYQPSITSDCTATESDTSKTVATSGGWGNDNDDWGTTSSVSETKQDGGGWGEWGTTSKSQEQSGRNAESKDDTTVSWDQSNSTMTYDDISITLDESETIDLDKIISPPKEKITFDDVLKANGVSARNNKKNKKNSSQKDSKKSPTTKTTPKEVASDDGWGTTTATDWGNIAAASTTTDDNGGWGTTTSTVAKKKEESKKNEDEDGW